VNREFLIDLRADGTHILLAGEFDIAALPAFYRAIRRTLKSRPGRVVINLDSVTFIDSSGLGAIVEGCHMATALSVGYRIGPAATPAVARVLAVTGLAEALVIDPVEDDAADADMGTAG
jgi:anti-sigma B factor antagonist